MSDEYFRKLLQKNYRQLTRDLEVTKVVNRLFELGVLDVEDKEDIEEPNRTKRAEKLLGKLMRRGEENFITFCEVLRELPSQKHLEKVLRRPTNEGTVPRLQILFRALASLRFGFAEFIKILCPSLHWVSV